MPRIVIRSTWLFVILLFGPAWTAAAADEPEQKPIDVYEWSVWVGSPAQASISAGARLQERDAGLRWHQPTKVAR